MKKILKKLLNFKFLLCFGLSWLICNSWSFIAIYLGGKFDIGWLVAAGSAWVGILMLPNAVGIIVPIPLAILFNKLFFPNDESIKNELMEFYNESKAKQVDRRTNRILVKENIKLKSFVLYRVIDIESKGEKLSYSVFDDDNEIGTLTFTKSDNQNYDLICNIDGNDYDTEMLIYKETKKYIKTRLRIAYVPYEIEI